MKKYLVLVLVALVSLTCVFATPTANTEGKTGDDTTQVSFKLTEAEIADHKIGFTSDSTLNLGEADPANLAKVDLTYSRSTKKATNAQPAYIFYYVNAKTLPKLYIECGNGLDNGVYSSKIGYKVVVGNVTATSDLSKPVKKEIPMTALDKGTTQGIVAFTVETTTTITADMADESNAYVDNIKLTISAT